MNEQMEFPETFERFAREYGFKDDKEVYTNGLDLIPIFRVNQWLEYDNKLRAIEADTAYECGKHANRWIPVSERLPEVALDEYGIRCSKDVLVCDGTDLRVGYFVKNIKRDFNYWVVYGEYYIEPKAWMPLPEPYKASPTGAGKERMNDSSRVDS